MTILVILDSLTKWIMQLQNKKKHDIFSLINYTLDENNPFNDELETEDIYIEDDLFDDTDQRDIKKVSEDIVPLSQTIFVWHLIKLKRNMKNKEK